MTIFHATKGGALAVQTTGRTVILAARAGGWYLGLSLGLPTWWLPRVERGLTTVVGWLWASVAIARVPPPGSTIGP